MAVIDSRGRLFGKVNLLDLVVVVAVVAVAGRFGYQKLAARSAAPVGEDKNIHMTFQLATVRSFTVDVLKVGDMVYDSKSNTPMGKVVTVKTEPATVVGTGPDGRLYESKSPDRFDYYVTIDGPARVSPNGITMSGIEVKVGRPNDFKTAYWAGTGVPVTLPR
jgi:hypothetical protein